MEEKNLIFKIIEFGLAHPFFYFKELKANVKLSADETSYCISTLMEFPDANTSPANHHILNCIGIVLLDSNTRNYDECRFSLLPNAIFQYTDYQEIVLARQSAQSAKRLSWIAIIITAALGVIQIGIAYLQLRN